MMYQRSSDPLPTIVESDTSFGTSEDAAEHEHEHSSPAALTNEADAEAEMQNQDTTSPSPSGSRKRSLRLLLAAAGAVVVVVGAAIGVASRVLYDGVLAASSNGNERDIIRTTSAGALRRLSSATSRSTEEGDQYKYDSDDNEPIHLVYSSDAQTVIGTKASIRSVRAHASGHVIFHFIGDEPLEGMPYVRFYPISKLKHKYNLEEFINTHPRHKTERENVNLNRNLPNYVRFVMDLFLPHVKKAMWIDSDTIVKCDVVEMARNVLNGDDENGPPIAAIPVEGKPKGLYEKDKYRNPIPDWGIETSFNAGVYFVNLDRWRKQGLTEKIRQLALKNREYRYWRMGSQPPLALTIGENFEHLPLSWNVKMKTIDEREDMSLEDACVFHWSGPSKPWDGFQHPEEWYPYVDESDKEMLESEEAKE